MDDLGATLAIRILLYIVPVPAARDELGEHPVQEGEAAEGFDGKREDQVSAGDRRRAHDGQGNCDDCARAALYPQFHGTHGVSAEPVHRLGVRPAVRLVRVLPHRLHGDLRLQPQHGGSLVRGHPRGHRRRHRAVLLVPAPLPGTAVQRGRGITTRETPACRLRWGFLHPGLFVLVRVVGRAHALDHADHRLRILRRRRAPPFQLRA